MPRLICRGSKTKVATEWDGQRTINRLTALNNGADLGEFTTAAEAKAHAEALLSSNPSGTYFVCHDDGSLTNWVYDLDEQRRIDRRHSWVNALLTACILAPITAAAIALHGVSPFSTVGLVLITASVSFYLIVRTCQNAIEGFVVWCIMFVLVMIAFPAIIKATSAKPPLPLNKPNQSSGANGLTLGR